jgi:hypothetical protein
LMTLHFGEYQVSNCVVSTQSDITKSSTDKPSGNPTLLSFLSGTLRCFSHLSSLLFRSFSLSLLLSFALTLCHSLSLTLFHLFYSLSQCLCLSCTLSLSLSHSDCLEKGSRAVAARCRRNTLLSPQPVQAGFINRLFQKPLPSLGLITAAFCLCILVMTVKLVFLCQYLVTETHSIATDGEMHTQNALQKR